MSYLIPEALSTKAPNVDRQIHLSPSVIISHLMSNLLHTRQRISELLGIFAWQAKAYTASGNTDFNKVFEDVLVPIFRLIFTLPDLKNLNTETKKNFPGIDLADDTAGIAFQVTATSDSQKIKDSLRTFVGKGFYNKYL